MYIVLEYTENVSEILTQNNEITTLLTKFSTIIIHIAGSYVAKILCSKATWLFSPFLQCSYAIHMKYS